MTSFDSSGLQPELLSAISELGYETPMPIQAEVIPYLLNGERDLIALAQTGTGKTAAFGLPLLQGLDSSVRRPQALILSPTRELCMQIAADLKDYSRHLDDIRILAVYGGSSVKNQLDSLRKGVHVIVATPGRLLDLLGRGAVQTDSISTVIMDEADEMLNMGFLDDIDSILSQLPAERRTMLFSATMPDEIRSLALKYMNDPHEIVSGTRNEGASTVRHICYTVRDQDRYRTLKRIVDYYPRIYGIIFCRTKVECQEVSEKLIHDGYNVDALHGDLSQAQRDNVMQRFRLHNIQLLVATDVAARGIDVDDLTHVINYNLPDENEVYTHRSGRTGRAGKTGISITIISMRDTHRIKAIERSMHRSFETGRIPTGQEICSKQIFNLMDRLEHVEVRDDELSDILPSVLSRMAWMDKEDLLRRLMALEFNRFIDYYQDDEDFEAEVKGSRRVIVERTAGYTKLFINVGKMDGIGPKELLNMLNGCIRHEVGVGRIDIFTRYSLFDVRNEDAEEVMFELGTLKLKGRPVRVTPATGEQIERGNRRSQFRKKNNSSTK